jgi:predicted RNA-binding protein associated with RNAse of E/G family
MTPRERYLTDALFHRLVDELHRAMREGVTTPTEAREAAMLAQIMYEEERPRYIPRRADREWLDTPAREDV